MKMIYSLLLTIAAFVLGSVQNATAGSGVDVLAGVSGWHIFTVVLIAAIVIIIAAACVIRWFTSIITNHGGH